MIKKQLLILLILLSSLAGYSQTITPQWKPLVNGVSEFHSGNKTPTQGYDSLMYMYFLRGLFKLKSDSISNSGYVTHGYFNSHSSNYSFTNGLTNSSGVVSLGGQLLGYTNIDPNQATFAIDGQSQNIFFRANSINGTASQSVLNLFPDQYSLLAYTNAAGTAQSSFEIRPTNILINDQINSRGIVNSGDYETNFVARSLVTKQYVTGAISSATIDTTQLARKNGSADMIQKSYRGSYSLFKYAGTNGTPPANYAELSFDNLGSEKITKANGDIRLLKFRKTGNDTVYFPYKNNSVLADSANVGASFSNETLQAVTNRGYVTTKPVVATDHIASGDSTKSPMLVCLCSSIGLAYGRGGSTVGGGGVVSADQRATSIVAKNMGLIEVNMGMSGRGFQQISGSDSSVTSKVTSIPFYTKGSFAFLEGVNDLPGDTTVYTASQFQTNGISNVNSLHNTKGWPYSSIIIVPTFAYFNKTPGTNAGSYPYRVSTYNTAANNIASATGALAYTTGYSSMKATASTDMPSDSLHLNITGNARLAGYLTTFLQSNFATNTINLKTISYGDQIINGGLKVYNDANFGRVLNALNGVNVSSININGIAAFTNPLGVADRANILFGSTTALPTSLINTNKSGDFQGWSYGSAKIAVLSYTGLSTGNNLYIGRDLNGSAASSPNTVRVVVGSTIDGGVGTERQEWFASGGIAVGNTTLSDPGANIFHFGAMALRSNSTGYPKFGGSAASATFSATIPLGTDVSGVLPIANGGHGTGASPSVNQIPIATSATVYTPTTVSGDLTNAAGVFTIGANKVTYGKIQAGTTLKLLGTSTGTAYGEVGVGIGLSYDATNLRVDTTVIKSKASALADYNNLKSSITKGTWVRSAASTLTLVYGQPVAFTGTTATYTLPAITSTNNTVSDFIRIKNAGSGNITINTASGAVIYDGSLVSTITLTPGASVTLGNDSVNFNKM